MSGSSVFVTLNVFSGLPNPRWELTPEQLVELERLLQTPRNPIMQKPAGASVGLGYRGIHVEWHRPALTGATHIHGGIIGTPDVQPNYEDAGRSLERWLLSTASSAIPSLQLRPEVDALVNTDLQAPVQPVLPTGAAVACPPCGGGAAPAYNPAAWNIPSVQPHNNCYNYATNTITNTFAQPGNGSGHPFAPPPDCPKVGGGAQSDGLVPVPSFAASVPNAYYVALVIWPGTDFHWYRQDRTGCWSHKPGQTPVRDVDNSGNKIIDPRSCNRGPYTNFCGYMTVAPGHISIR